MRDYSDIKLIPKMPGVYCLLGYSAKADYPAYVGIGGNLQSRISQHLEYRNSSVTTGASAVSLDASQVRACKFWTDPSLVKKERLGALELIAFEELNPVLRSRGGINREAKLLANDAEFRKWALDLLRSDSGYVSFPSVQELANRIAVLEKRLEAIERRIGKG